MQLSFVWCGLPGQALSNKKLFVLDYHDRFLSYIKRINELKGSQAYASWTLFVLTKDAILKPVCIELALPPAKDGENPELRVFRPNEKDVGKNWAWELAKAHVQSNDASFTSQKYALEMSSKVYAGWRFVDQALPNDLIKR